MEMFSASALPPMRTSMPLPRKPRVRISVSRSSMREPAPEAAAPSEPGPDENRRVLPVVVGTPPLTAKNTGWS